MAASAKVANAGVEGLLARPLFVVTAVLVVGVTAGVAESRLVSFSSVDGLLMSSFLLPLEDGTDDVACASGSILMASGLEADGLSFRGFPSLPTRPPLLCVAASGACLLYTSPSPRDS